VIDWLNDNQGAATVLLTLALVGVNVAFLIVNYLTRRDAQKAQFGARMALTGGSFSVGESKLTYRVSNIGRGPAQNVYGER
jgi:hypothetical protein